VSAVALCRFASFKDRNVLIRDAEPDERSWSEIASIALRSNDDHIAKIVYGCFEEAAAYADPAYLQVAQRAVLDRG